MTGFHPCDRRRSNPSPVLPTRPSDGRESNVEGDIAESARWNHKIHDHRLLLDAAPVAARGLDVPLTGTPGDLAHNAV